MKLLLVIVLVVAAFDALSREVTCAPVENYSSTWYVRNSTARLEFRRATGWHLGRPGYHVDHMRPLKCGGGDCPANMQWLSIEDKKINDKWELDCSRYMPIKKEP